MHLVNAIIIRQIISLIHSFSIAPRQVHYYSVALLTQHGYCVGVSRWSTTGNCEWRTCPRVTVIGFEPMTLRTKGDESTNEPPCPTMYVYSSRDWIAKRFPWEFLTCHYALLQVARDVVKSGATHHWGRSSRSSAWTAVRSQWPAAECSKVRGCHSYPRICRPPTTAAADFCPATPGKIWCSVPTGTPHCVHLLRLCLLDHIVSV